MKRQTPWLLLALVVVVGASLKYTPNASSSSSNQQITVARAVPKSSNLVLPFATTLDVDRTDDTAAASACTIAANDCSLRGAIIAANAAAGATPVIINLASGTTYSLTLTNATQENAAVTGDLDNHDDCSCGDDCGRRFVRTGRDDYQRRGIEFRQFTRSRVSRDSGRRQRHLSGFDDREWNSRR